MFYVLMAHGNTENLSPGTLKEWEEALNMFSEGDRKLNDSIVYARRNNKDGSTTINIHKGGIK